MTFSEVYNLILESCPFLRGNSYDGIIVKKLAATNTISDTGSSHQSHMAFTGKQKDFFPFLEADGYFNVDYDNKDDDLKKYYTLRIPLNIYADNVNSLSQENTLIEFNSPKKIVRASVLRSRRKGQEDQVELSIKSLDDKDFIEFRKLLRVNDFFVLLKKQNVLEYDLIGISSSDKNAAILATCTDFYKLTTQTPVDIDFFGDVKKEAKESNTLPFTPTQIIYYGVPGCGKSHTVDAEINKAIKEYNVGKEKDLQITYEKQVIRTVFHPDYCNADFVGQLMPKKGKESGIKYEFKPGPLATIIRKAYLNPKKPYFLVIEEINRGNAAAIFGEMFQLLDRYKKNEHSKTEDTQNENYDYTEGWSKYSVNNDELNEFILLGGESKIVEKEPGVEYDSDFPDGPKAAIKIPSIGLHFSTYCGVRLPPNLSIYATMNTSDQNVFTLDNAFQRRWEMKQVPNKLRNSLPENATEEQKKELEAEIEQYNEYIGGTKEEGGTGVKWGVFRDEINRIIMKSAEDNGLSSMEDKRLGGWFIVPKKPDEKEDSKAVITKQAFAEKVLKYLWDDAFKFDRNSHFNFNKDEEPTLEKLIENFDTKEFEVFIDPKIRELQKKTPSGDSPQNAATKEQ